MVGLTEGGLSASKCGLKGGGSSGNRLKKVTSPAATVAALEAEMGLDRYSVVRQSRWCQSGGQRLVGVSPAVAKAQRVENSPKLWEKFLENMSGQC